MNLESEKWKDIYEKTKQFFNERSCSPLGVHTIIEASDCYKDELWWPLLKETVDSLCSVYRDGYFDGLFGCLFASPKSRWFLGVTMSNYLHVRHCEETHGNSACSADLRNNLKNALRYCSISKVKFAVNKRRRESIVDMPLKSIGICGCGKRPLYLALYFNMPQTVHLLLKYGAKIFEDDVCICSQASAHIVLEALRKWQSANSNRRDDATRLEQEERMNRTLQWLLIDVPCCSALWQPLRTMLLSLENRKQVQIFMPSLKHMCRTVIRKAINSSHSLPFSIGEIMVPESLKEYLSLSRTNDW